MFIHKFRARFPTRGALETNNAYLDWIQEKDEKSGENTKKLYLTIDDDTLISEAKIDYRRQGDSAGYTSVVLNNLSGNTSYYITDVEAFNTNGSYYLSVEGVNTTCKINPNTFAPRDFVSIESAQSFTDEENPVITYKVNTDYRYFTDYGTKIGILKPKVDANNICSVDDFLIYRDITVEGGINGSIYSYTLNLTEEERELLRNTFNTSATNKIRFALLSSAYINTSSNNYNYSYFKSGSDGWKYVTGTNTAYSCIEKTLTIVNCQPQLAPYVKDIKPETLALTGDENIIVRYESMAEYGTRAIASKGAEIVSQSVECGSKKITDMYNGVIDNVESGTFIFNAADSRGLRADTVVVHKTLISYVKPTCYQEFEIRLSSKTSAEISLKVSGNYYSGSFGLVDNTFLLEMRYGKKGEALSEWTPIENTPTFRDNKYEVQLIFDGFHYEDSYTFQCRITDKLNFVQSSQYTVKMLPVYDWSKEDFNFNVPIKMNGETVLRHNTEANNTVLSASGGHIYLRPKGTDDTDGETIIYPDGSIKFGKDAEFSGDIKFGGKVDFGGESEVNSLNINNLSIANSLTINENPVADYIIETGSEAMGSNGTWYWSKWASGKAECYGKRNFGKMAITTKKVDDVYRSATLTQDLPSGLFSTAPEFINISTYPNGATSYQYCWIGIDGNTAASESSTGGFCVMSCLSQTSSASDISFHVIGRW